jgi:serine/threonine protein kinase
LSDLLLRWRDLRDRGVEASPEQLCHEHPDLVGDLRAKIEAVQSMERLMVVEDRATMVTEAATPAGPVLMPSVTGYELLGELGRGGMGVVYKAIQKNLNRPVALKMILSGAHAGAHQVARFKAEAEALARLRHPNIVQVHEAGESNGLLYLSLEYVAGGGLDRHMAGRALVETMARAIHVAHEAGIIHRDLKPANVLLAEGRAPGPRVTVNSPRELTTLIPKITDFGLAKMTDSEGQTHSGSVLGTPNYMAPEQAEGRVKDIGPAADVYALGAILYECLTGNPPFRGETIMETIRQVSAAEPVAPSRLSRQVPRDLETICLKCLRKETASRYPTAEALADDLRRFLDGHPIEARPVGTVERSVKWLKRRPERLILVAFLLVALPLLGVLYSLRERDEEPDPLLASKARHILHKYCFQCHGHDADIPEGDLAILDYPTLVERSVVVPGDTKRSLLIERIEDNSMPPVENEEHPRLSSDETETLKRWIRADAPPFEGATAEELLPHPPPLPLAVAARDVLKAHCYECHNFRNAKSGIKILNHDLLVEKRKLVLPKNAEESPLWKTMVTDNKQMMPPKDRPRLKPGELETVRKWIEAGAPPFPLSHEPGND